jgi:leader peptidase (prepilin peptidase) / N-methyltransferase
VGGEAFFLVVATLLGLVFGSFLNVCIVRLPNEDPKARSLVRPPSSCPKCHREIVWYDNIPVVSWLLLRGRCRWCGELISAQYIVIEVLVGALWLTAALLYGPTPRMIDACVLGTILLGIAIIDARHYVIPDELSYGGLVIGLGLALFGGVTGFVTALIGAAAGWGLLWLVRVIGGYVLKQEAMGWGDVKMLAMIGAFVGWQGVLLTVFLGALSGSLIFLPLQLMGKKRLVPFGVFLAVGGAVTFLFRDSILSWYAQFLHGA